MSERENTGEIGGAKKEKRKSLRKRKACPAKSRDPLHYGIVHDSIHYGIVHVHVLRDSSTFSQRSTRRLARVGYYTSYTAVKGGSVLLTQELIKTQGKH